MKTRTHSEYLPTLNVLACVLPSSTTASQLMCAYIHWGVQPSSCAHVNNTTRQVYLMISTPGTPGGVQTTHRPATGASAE